MGKAILLNHGTGKVSADKVTAGTLAGRVKANEDAMAVVSVAQVRNASAGTTDLTDGTSPLASGEFYVVYEEG